MAHLNASDTGLLQINHDGIIVSTQNRGNGSLEPAFRRLTQIGKSTVNTYKSPVNIATDQECKECLPGKIRFKFDTVSLNFAFESLSRLCTPAASN
jgi:hypothetical protein